MSAPPPSFSRDLYRLLRLPRAATAADVKRAWREAALALHPDRHDGCEVKAAEFREASEAYRVLSDHALRRDYDRWLDGVEVGPDGSVRMRSRAAERNPFYRKVYSPAAPPGMKIFNRQRHYDMHYGDGMMREEIERARRRAEAASPRGSRSYQSPLGAGFSFDGGRPMGDQMNPYSRRGTRQHDHLKNGGFRIEYEESYIEMNGGTLEDARKAMGGKEYVVERAKDRRRERVRERGEPLPRRARRRAAVDAEGSGCVIM